MPPNHFLVLSSKRQYFILQLNEEYEAMDEDPMLSQLVPNDADTSTERIMIAVVEQDDEAEVSSGHVAIPYPLATVRKVS